MGSDRNREKKEKNESLLPSARSLALLDGKDIEKCEKRKK